MGRTGLYIHWPFCTRICPYCDFNVYRDRGADAALWREALLGDLAWWREKAGISAYSSVYFGGGTPSLMAPSLARAVIEAAKPVPGAEVTLEANPTDAERERFSDFAAAGVNRLSLGVQSLRDKVLTFLGRNHSVSETIEALEVARGVFERLTFDLIYARPGQSLDDWRGELSEALALAKGHLSLYQLTIEPGTAFDRAVARGDWAPAGEDMTAAQYDLAQQMCTDAGLLPYEVSNNAAPGHEAQHNLLYWRYQAYVGIGPGAHGRVRIGGQLYETVALANPKDYLAATPVERFALTPLSGPDQAVEMLSMGLRLSEGVSLSRYEALAGAPLQAQTLDYLAGDGLVLVDGDQLRLTADGRRVLNGVLLDLTR
ncbi:radical SAM family heme chaperone HemW [Aquisalinus flavus]|uniref:Heme chaperone HemW n=2 Tax=Aquisalinus flavus TaxID=1526572 RepID=A0A8J2V3F1_9PROT|nr:radical SAM family heme chaperone HemW [Aquisalinus flavus]MBD0425536.1 radical SAM family heme chaperone HemW [Aquisalinus flavus]UNE48836.1 radical SAM family heme chaperone HemW [Aquisalinus flavus]GGD15272.1 coproporphyrinogen III oxidase [Aquisalinus flavus]